MCVMIKDDSHFRLRIPADLKERIEDAAKANGRSLNAEIAYRLKETFNAPPDPDDLEKIIANFEKALAMAKAIARKGQ